MNASQAYANNIEKWKINLVKKHFQLDGDSWARGRADSTAASPQELEAEFESIFSETFIETYNPDEAFSSDETLNSPQSLKDLASKATTFNDSGYEGQHSGVKPRGNLTSRARKTFLEEVEEEKGKKVELQNHREEKEDEHDWLAFVLDFLKMFVVVMSLLYMTHMSDSSVDVAVGGKKAAIKFYYDNQ